MDGDEQNNGDMSHSLGVKTRGLRLILAPADDDDPPDSAPPSYPPSTASLSPSPLLPPDSPYSTLATPRVTKRAHFPDLPPPPSSTGGFTLQLPPILRPSHHQCPADPISDNQGTRGPSAVVESNMEGDSETGCDQEEVQQQEKSSLKSEGVWRRHMSLEINPLMLLSSSQDRVSSDWEDSLGKSLTVHSLSQPLSNRCHSLSSALNNNSSSHRSQCVNAHGGLDKWDEAELFINDCKLEPEAEHFNFLSQKTGMPSDRMQHVEGNSDFLSQPHHIQLA